MTEQEYKQKLLKGSRISQCDCFITDEYYKEHKDEKIVVVMNNGCFLQEANEFNTLPIQKRIGTLEELTQEFKGILKSKPRYPRTLYNAIITNRSRNVCVVMRPYIREIDG